MKRIDLEGLKALLVDEKVSIAIGKVLKVELLEDYSVARALISVFPDEYQVVARVSFPHANAGGGFFVLPNPDDLVLLAFSSPDDVFVIAYLSSTEDLIPQQTKEGHTLVGSRPGKTMEIFSNTKGLLSKNNVDAPPTEPLVLGNVLKSMFTELHAEINKITNEIRKLSSEIQTGDILFSGAPGGPTAPNPSFVAKHTSRDSALQAIEAAVTEIQRIYVTDAPTNIVSQLWFTERGGE